MRSSRRPVDWRGGMMPCLAPAARNQRSSSGGDREALISRWAARGWLRNLDAAFAGFLWREVAGADPLLILAAALASHQLATQPCLSRSGRHARGSRLCAVALPPEGGYRDALAAADLPRAVLAC